MANITKVADFVDFLRAKILPWQKASTLSGQRLGAFADPDAIPALGFQNFEGIDARQQGDQQLFGSGFAGNHNSNKV